MFTSAVVTNARMNILTGVVQQGLFVLSACRDSSSCNWTMASV